MWLFCVCSACCRKIEQSSPLALVAHWVLTMYHAMMLAAFSEKTPDCDQPWRAQLRASVTSENARTDGCKAVRVHWAGAEKELDQLWLLRELDCLLGDDIQLELHMISPSVPSCLDGRRCSKSRALNMRTNIWLHRGLYHDPLIQDRLAQHGIAHMFIGLNAGVAAYSSWHETIRLLVRSKIAAMFSDLNEEAAVLATKCIDHLSTDAMAPCANGVHIPMASCPNDVMATVSPMVSWPPYTQWCPLSRRSTGPIIRQSIHLFFRPFVRSSVWLAIRLDDSRRIRPSIDPSTCRSDWAYPPTHWPTFPAILPSIDDIHPSTLRPIHPS